MGTNAVFDYTIMKAICILSLNHFLNHIFIWDSYRSACFLKKLKYINIKLTLSIVSLIKKVKGKTCTSYLNLQYYSDIISLFWKLNFSKQG